MIGVERVNEAVEISLDDVGIDQMIARLQAMKGIKTHIHMMTPEWGGKELSGTATKGELVNHIIIYSSGMVREV